MIEFKRQLIAAARAEHGEIFPCGNRTSLADSFTYNSGQALFWFKTGSSSSNTKITSLKITDQNIREAEEAM
ncbi:MAG: hypothetical protein KOO65_05390 [Desulfobacterales bacterium]|nr:hypothetical protein [Desulfobacterales bacterium]